jgi:hypothetical protein
MEARWGPLGTGQAELWIAGRRYGLADLLLALGLNFEDVRPIDAQAVPAEGRFVIRYVDLEERRVVAYEFDAALGYLAEARVHLAEWMGDDAFGAGWPGGCPAPR